MELMARHM